MNERIHMYTMTGKMRKTTFSEVTKWVQTSWKAVEKTSVTSGFQETSLLMRNADFDKEEIEDDPETDEESSLDNRFL